MNIQRQLLKGIIVLILIVGYFTFFSIKREDKLKKNLQSVVAKITEIEPYYNEGKQCKLILNFEKRGTSQTLEKSITPMCDCDFYKNKYVLIAFDSTDLENNHLFTKSLDCEKYGLMMADSLRWIDGCQTF